MNPWASRKRSSSTIGSVAAGGERAVERRVARRAQERRGGVRVVVDRPAREGLDDAGDQQLHVALVAVVVLRHRGAEPAVVAARTPPSTAAARAATRPPPPSRASAAGRSRARSASASRTTASRRCRTRRRARRGGTWSGPPSAVTRATKSTIAARAGPSFQEARCSFMFGADARRGLGWVGITRKGDVASPAERARCARSHRRAVCQANSGGARERSRSNRLSQPRDGP